MDNTKTYANYRLQRAKETYEDALILKDKSRWNSTINRLYYAAFYAVMALLISKKVKTSTHNGVKISFNKLFIKTKEIPQEYGKLFAQLFTWRQKGDYDDLYDFNEAKVLPYFKPVESLIEIVENIISTDN